MMRISIVSCLVAGMVLICESRPVPCWPYEKLAKEADLIVIATPAATKETKEKLDIPSVFRRGPDGICRPVPGMGLETTFNVLAVLKGNKDLKSFVFFHLREAEPQTVSVNGPGLVSFDARQKKRFLLFLKRDADGRYSALTGQTDPDGSVKDLGTYP